MNSPKCFANLHLRPGEYALWDVARSLSHETGILYFDGRDIAALFEDTGKDIIYRAAKSLIAKGWFEVLSPPKRDARSGLFTAAKYRVLSPEEWGKRFPHTHASSRVGANGDQSQVRERPFASTRMTSRASATYSVKENIEENNLAVRSSDSTLYGSDAILPAMDTPSPKEKPTPINRKSKNIAGKVARNDSSFKSYRAARLAAGKPDPWDEKTQAAFDALGYQLDLDSDEATNDFVLNVVNVYEEHRDETSPHIICCKIIDQCVEDIDRCIDAHWPPSFQAHRDHLRAEERELEVDDLPF